MINQSTHKPNLTTHESSRQAEKCVATVKFQLLGQRLALVSVIKLFGALDRDPKHF